MNHNVSLLASHLSAQPIDINKVRTFQQASKEPLGEDWHAELRSLQGGKEAASVAIQKAQTNADPGVAQLRSDAAFLQRTYTALPEGEARLGLLQRSADLRAEAEELAAAAGLQPTAVRAGKQARRARKRVIAALFPGRKNSKGKRRDALAQAVAPENRCDELPTLGKKGKAVHKVRALQTRWILQDAGIDRLCWCSHSCCRCVASPCRGTWMAPSCATVPLTIGGSGRSGRGAAAAVAGRRCLRGGAGTLGSNLTRIALAAAGN